MCMDDMTYKLKTRKESKHYFVSINLNFNSWKKMINGFVQGAGVMLKFCSMEYLWGICPSTNKLYRYNIEFILLLLDFNLPWFYTKCGASHSSSGQQQWSIFELDICLVVGIASKFQVNLKVATPLSNSWTSRAQCLVILSSKYKMNNVCSYSIANYLFYWFIFTVVPLLFRILIKFNRCDSCVSNAGIIIVGPGPAEPGYL